MHGKKIKPVLVVPSWLMCKEFVLRRDVQTLIPRLMIEEDISKGRLIEVDTKVPMGKISFYAIHKKERNRPRNAHPFLNTLKEIQIRWEDVHVRKVDAPTYIAAMISF